MHNYLIKTYSYINLIILMNLIYIYIYIYIEKYIFYILVPPKLYYRDFDIDFIHGMLDELREEYKGVYDEPTLDRRLKYGGNKYKLVDRNLSQNAQKLKMRTEKDLQSVMHDLDNLGRRPIEVREGVNNPFDAICIQVYTPSKYNGLMLRHQACGYMCEFVHFFHPKMKKYLDDHKIGFSQYILKMFTGEIWCDEFILGAISRMWNIRISIVSPHYCPVWDLFHGGGTPHVVLIINGTEFGKSKCVTHFSSSKGKGAKWDCISPPNRMAEIGLYSGRCRGSQTALELYDKVERMLAIQKVTKINYELNQMCEAVVSLSQKRDKLLESMEELNLKVDHLKRVQRYKLVQVNTQVRPKLGPLKRIDDEYEGFSQIDAVEIDPHIGGSKRNKSDESQKVPKKDIQSTKEVIVDQMEVTELMQEFVDEVPKVHENVNYQRREMVDPEVSISAESHSERSKLHKRTKEDQKGKIHGVVKITKYMSDKEKVRQVKVSKTKEKNEKDDADEKITKMLLTFKQKDKQHGKFSRTEKRQISQEKVSEEDVPLPSLQNVEHMIDCENIDMQPGVVKVTDIALPIEEKTVEFDTEVEQSNEYSGNFEITDDDKNAVDRYLIQQNVITTQPIRKTMNRSDSLPNYEDVNADAPGNTHYFE